ncbi:MAG TPA: GTPase Era [bacterium]|nr:GTPase Era [bacterium]
MSPDALRSGFVALAGRPNVGKSTLLNRLVGAKVAITASAPQTTRTRVQGVLTLPDAQIVFIDTPGIHDPRHRLGERMVAQAREALKDADVILAIFDASVPLTEEDRLTARHVRQAGKPAVAALNKADRVTPDEAEARGREVRDLAPFTSVVPVSATRGAGIDRLIEAIVALVPQGPQYFPPDMVTDQPEQFLVREFIREQAIALTREELPHSVAVEIEEFEERSADLVYIRATIHVERESHKKMLIGRGGRMLKEIGRRARAEIEVLLRRRLYLDLWVKTSKDWRQRDEMIRAFYPEQR